MFCWGCSSKPISYKHTSSPLDTESSCEWMTLLPLRSGPLVCFCCQNLFLDPSYVSQHIPHLWHVLTLCWCMWWVSLGTCQRLVNFWASLCRKRVYRQTRGCLLVVIVFYVHKSSVVVLLVLLLLLWFFPLIFPCLLLVIDALFAVVVSVVAADVLRGVVFPGVLHFFSLNCLQQCVYYTTFVVWRF